MTVEIPLPDWDPQTAWWAGVGLYLFVSWVVAGPLLARWVWRNEVADNKVQYRSLDPVEWADRSPEPYLAWFFSPLLWPVVLAYFVLRPAVVRAIYPPESGWRSK